MSEVSLFLDTSSFIQLGLLDKECNWISYELIKNRKGSQVIHSLIHNLLLDNGIKIKDIKRLIVANGPGSYTGIRLAEGFAQVLENENIEVINFYHFEVPYLLGIDTYQFIASAFKNEFFSFKMSKGEEEQALISNDEFLKLEDSDSIFHIGDEVSGRVFKSTYPLFESKSTQIFNEVIKNSSRKEPFYFRPLDKEFKASNLRT